MSFFLKISLNLFIHWMFFNNIGLRLEDALSNFKIEFIRVQILKKQNELIQGAFIIAIEVGRAKRIEHELLRLCENVSIMIEQSA